MTVQILMVSHAFPPHSKGGVEVCTAHVAGELLRRRHAVQVFHRVARAERPEYEAQHDTWEAVPVTTINNTFARARSFETTYRNREIEEVFSRLLHQIEPDVVHFEHLTCLSTGLVQVAKGLGIPSVLTLHDYWLPCQRGQMLQPDLTLCDEPEENKCSRCMAPHILAHRQDAFLPTPAGKHWRPTLPFMARRLILKRFPGRATQADLRIALEAIRARNLHVQQVISQADLLLTPSEFHRSQFIRFGVDPGRIRAQYNGLRTELFDGFRPSPSDQVRFVFLGSVIPSKGVHLLVSAFNALDDEHATLDIHGWAPQYEGFPSYLHELKAAAGTGISFRGSYDNAQIADILANADVVVIPSIWNESASMIAHEAFLAGVPVIAARIGALTEFVEHRVNGLHFEPRNVDDLRNQMQCLIDDPRLRAELGQNPGIVRTIEQQATELEALYDQLMVNAGKSHRVRLQPPAPVRERQQ